MNVVLIGFSGSGKSSVGRMLAQRLGWELIDTDAEVERVSGKRIHQIFSDDGEPAFRRLEREAVGRAFRGASRIVAVGGGAVMDPANRRAMRDGNLVVLLDAGVDTLHRRLAAAAEEEPRPMLGVGDGERGRLSTDPTLTRISTLKAVRDPVYRETAHLTILTEGIDVEGIADRVVAAIMAAVGDAIDPAGER